MTLPGKGFWVGLVTGLILAGGYGAYALNHQLRMNHTKSAFSFTATALHLNAMRARFEAGETERAESYHRMVAWGLNEFGRYENCVAKSRWALGGSRLHGCTLNFPKTIPENWEIPGLDHARERLARQQAARSRQPDTGS